MSELPWAEYILPFGAASNLGGFIPSAVGDYVWIEYPHDGDTRRPLIVGGAHFCPDGSPNMPNEAWSGPDVVSHKREGAEPVPAAPGYHRDVVFTRHGVTVEIAEDSSVRVTQRGSGSAIEIAAGGDITIHGEGNIHISAQTDCNLIVKGNAAIDVTGNVTAGVTGNVMAEIGGAANVKAAGPITCESSVMATLKAPQISMVGPSGVATGVVTGECLCLITGLPHLYISQVVKASAL
jgi:hypothetical protein